MNTYLIHIDIKDGENEYGDFALISSLTLKNAEAKAREWIKIHWGNNRENWNEEERKLDLGSRQIMLTLIQQIRKEESDVLRRYFHWIRNEELDGEE